ncbi:MAG: hypothetical protein EOO67_11010 [Microbacterium sp.]|nr:MAG: hypothetical protein EOO67_11010 [Microbacterium sp.]
MDDKGEGRHFKVAITQGDRWRAHLPNGGEVASAPSLYELRRQVINTAAHLLTADLEDQVVIEWTYVREGGEPHVEKQRITRESVGPTETSARVGWHQRRVDQYLEKLRRSRPRTS